MGLHLATEAAGWRKPPPYPARPLYVAYGGMDLRFARPGVTGDGESQSLQLARSSRGQKPVMRTFGLRRRAVPLGLSASGWPGPGTALTGLTRRADQS